MRFLLLVVALVVGTGCTSVKSSEVKTGGMSAAMAVTADGTGESKVSATLNVDRSTTDFVDLSDGDFLVATVAGKSQTLSRAATLLGVISYETIFDGQDAEGTPYTVALNRAKEVSAPSSTCGMTRPFAITAPAAHGTFSRSSSDIVISYDHPGTPDAMVWTVDTQCSGSQPRSDNVPGDTGSFTIPKGTVGGSNVNTGDTCEATVTLTRSRPGQLDPHFGYGGSIVAAQVRTLAFTSTP